jgi:2-phospho-L-lactate guanylyltransferase
MIPALVPVKPLGSTKSRLRAALGEGATERLAVAMLGDVVAALRDVPRLGPVAVVTPDPAVAEAARRAGAEALLVPDPGLNASLERGAKQLTATVSRARCGRWRNPQARSRSGETAPLGAPRTSPPAASRATADPDAGDALLVVLGDVAGVRARDVEALLDALAAAAGGGVVLAPSADGGTAALLRAPRDAIPLCFGPRSAWLHRTQAAGRGVCFRELDLPSLRIDLDTEEDLRAFLAGPGDGPRTRRLLHELGFAERA